MRKIVVFNAITVDGFFEGLNQEIDWHNVDEEFNQFAKDQLLDFDALLFGRKTYELMAGYWPTEGALNDDPVIANLMSTTPKYVFSNTLAGVDWQNTTLLSGNLEEQIRKIKNQPGRDIIIFGSGELTSGLLDLGLIDELRLLLNPILLGSGLPLFQSLSHRIPLKFTRSRVFQNGNVLLYYAVEN